MRARDWNAFQTDMKRAVLCRGFAASTLGTALAALLGVWRSFADLLAAGGLQPSGTASELILQALRSRFLLFALPALASLPHACSFMEDLGSRFARSYVPRTGRRAYIGSRIVSTGLAGFLAILGGALLAAGALALAVLPLEAEADPLATGEAQVEMAAAGAAMLSSTCLLALSGFFWPLVGAIAAAGAKNRYLGLIFPFIAYYFLIILSTRYFPDLYTLNPQQWAAPTESWGNGSWGAALLVVLLSAAAACVLALLMEKRLADV